MDRATRVDEQAMAFGQGLTPQQADHARNGVLGHFGFAETRAVLPHDLDAPHRLRLYEETDDEAYKDGARREEGRERQKILAGPVHEDHQRQSNDCTSRKSE